MNNIDNDELFNTYIINKLNSTPDISDNSSTNEFKINSSELYDNNDISPRILEYYFNQFILFLSLIFIIIIIIIFAII